MTADIEAKLHHDGERALVRRVALGYDAQTFLGSDIGRELCRRAEEDRVHYVEELIATTIDTEVGQTRNRELRFKIAVIDHWQDGLASLINEGTVAEAEFIAQRES